MGVVASDNIKKKGKKKKKDKPRKENDTADEGLTRDEMMALEIYDSIRKNKSKEESEDESEEEEDVDNQEEGEEESSEAVEDPVNTYNNVNEDLEEGDIDEKRGVTYQMAKNKGLTPKRSKLQRNPRVKNRMKYTKALKRRKGAVREVREQSSKYGGEASGINMRVKKGVKFS